MPQLFGGSSILFYSFFGNNVVSDIHLGDWGMPIAQIIAYIEDESIDINTLDSNQLEIIYPKASKQYKDNKEFKVHAQEINKLLNNNDSELLKIWELIKNISIKSLEENFSLLEFSKIPKIVQYSSIINFSISNSLSQTNLRATD